MAAVIARFTTFVAATPILSNDMNSELNALVNLLAGSSSSIKAVFKVSDAGDPPLEVNQLSTGPIQKWFQAGVEKARVRNDGSIRTPGVYDTNDNEQLLFVSVASAVNEFSVANGATGNPPELRATGNNTDIGVKLVPKGTGVVQIQSGAPVAGADAANKTYVDDRLIGFSIDWFYPSLPAAVESVESQGRLIIPLGTAWTITSVTGVWAGGSDSGASNIFTIKRRNSSGTLQSDVGTVDINTPAQNALQSNTVSVAVNEGDQIYPLFTTRNTANETLVSIGIRGTRKLA